jgi:hypothetical protein
MLHNLVFQLRRIETEVLSLDPATTRLGMRLLSAMKNWPVWSRFAVALFLSVVLAVPDFRAVVVPSDAVALTCAVVVAWIFSHRMYSLKLRRMSCERLQSNFAQISFTRFQQCFGSRNAVKNPGGVCWNVLKYFSLRAWASIPDHAHHQIRCPTVINITPLPPPRARFNG